MFTLTDGIEKRSHPSRVRGLKLASYYRQTVRGRSHPSRVRGLKQVVLPTLYLYQGSRTPRGCVD